MKHEYKLSICMMVKDEEKNLIRCLDSLKPLIDSGQAELIIVDTGSKDKSVDIAKTYTDKVYFNIWNNNFSDMRNVSISYAKGEWIFIIDADERLDNPLELIDIMNSKDINNYNCIMLKVKNLYRINDEKQYNLVVSPRIFKNDGLFRYEGVVHNQPIYKGPELNTSVSLTHFGYINNDKILMEKKFKRTSGLLKAELEKSPNNLYYMYQLGVSYDMHDDHKEALDEFRNAYQILKSQNRGVKREYIYIYSSYIRAAYTNNEYNEAMGIYNEAVSLAPDYIDLYYLAGIIQEQLKNKSEALKYFLKYDELYDKYYELDISKDMSVIAYHMDAVSKSNVYFGISDYYYEDGDLEKAEHYCRKIDDETRRACLTAKILIKLRDYKGLLSYYSDLKEDKAKDSILLQIEQQLKHLDEDEKKQFYMVFSQVDDEYGMLNKIRISDDEKKETFVREFFKKIDLNKASGFYYDVYNYIGSNMKLILSTFKGINTITIRNIVKYLIDKSEDFCNGFRKYLMTESIRANDVQSNRVFVAVAAVLLVERLNSTDEIDDDYYNIYKLYIDRGINYVTQLYHIEKARVIYKEINNDEDRFFILMYIFNDYILKNNMKTAIKYLMEALDCNKYMAKYIDKYKDEIFKQQDRKASNQEFEEYKIKVKETIGLLISQNLLNEAKEVIAQYESIVKGDIEILLYKSQIALIES